MHVLCYWLVLFRRPPGAPRMLFKPESNQENRVHTFYFIKESSWRN